MEVIEDGNIMDRIPILLQRDIEYYEKNHTVLSESVCRGVVGGRLDFPRNASFAAVKVVLWLEEEFAIAFNQGSGMFVTIEGENNADGGVVKTSDPDKFVQLAVMSTDLLLEHLHMLAQEALDHADLPVLTSTLGAAALLKNSLWCYLQHTEEMGSAERHATLQACYKRYASMAEAVGERVLDLHSRVLSLYVLQDAGGRPARGSGAPSVQGWWLYINGSRRDLWDTVPPRMAQRIFAGMLNETLTILTVRYCQTDTTEASTPHLINDIVNILLCVAQLLPAICASGAELAGLQAARRARDVRDVHAKCQELFRCMVYRGADLHFIHQAFTEPQDSPAGDSPSPWFAFARPELCAGAAPGRALPLAAALGLELAVLLAQPQPCWLSLVKSRNESPASDPERRVEKLAAAARAPQTPRRPASPAGPEWRFQCLLNQSVIMMRDCHLARALLAESLRRAPREPARWAASGLWYGGRARRCAGFLCTADGYCNFKGDDSEEEQYARVAGALTYVLVTIGSQAELRSTLCYALELSGRDWSACLDKRQVWCDRRPSWLAGLLAVAGTALQFIPPILVRAVQSGASMYQTMSLCLSCVSRSLPCVGRRLAGACSALQAALPARARPAGGSVLLQALLTVLYEDTLHWAAREAEREDAAAAAAEANGDAQHSNTGRTRPKHVRIAGLGHTKPSASVDSTHSASSIALAVAEALCSLDEENKHTREIEQLVAAAARHTALSDQFGLEDFPEFAEFFEEGSVPGALAERASDAAALTSQTLMAPPGRDSLRVIYEHLQLHAEQICSDLGVRAPCARAPLLYTMFHIGHLPFDQYLRGEWAMPWSRLVAAAHARGGPGGARAHLPRRHDLRAPRRARDPRLADLAHLLKAPEGGLLQDQTTL